MTFFVPISLMVTMEMVKLFQGMLLVKDKSGYSPEYDFFCTANNTSVNENLGQIKYVFTDKTGTLTKNNMIFKNLICGGKLYGSAEEKKKDNNWKAGQAGQAGQAEKVSYDNKSKVDFKDATFEAEKGNAGIQDALKILSLCHEIAVEIDEGKRNYNSSSPDEVALI